MNRLTHATVMTQLLPSLRGRALTTSRNQHLLVDAPLVLGGPNEEMNPIDLMLSALTSHAIFICEHTAQQQNIPLTTAHITAHINFNPLGVIGQPICPDFQALNLEVVFSGPNEQQAQALCRAIQTRCPIYIALSHTTTINLELKISPAIG